MDIAFAQMKKAAGRALVCIAESVRPLSEQELKIAIAEKYDKEPGTAGLQASISYLQQYGWVDNELALTNDGKKAYRTMLSNRGQQGWATKFFTKSQSPNVGPRAPARTPAQQHPQHAAIPGLSVVR